MNYNYNGWVESIHEFLICGWAVNSNDFSQKIDVDFIINGKRVAKRNAHTFRGDLKEAGVSDGYAVFDFCPFYWLQEEENHVQVVYSGTDITVPNGYAVLKSSLGDIRATEINRLNFKPKISIIMPIYNVDIIWLEKAIKSVMKQIYTNWELCIVDDASPNEEIRTELGRYSKIDKRIKVQYFKKNKGVSEASNMAVKIATGNYIGFLDHDDEIFKNALFEVVKAVNTFDADIIYSDEHIMDMTDGNHALHFKPDFSPDLLCSHNYITHFLVVRKELFEQVGGLSSRYDGAQDYDLILKLTEKTNKIYHIPKPLYSWRITAKSRSLNAKTKPFAVEAGHAALAKAIERRNIDGEVVKSDSRGYYRVVRKVLKNPLVSIVIPFRDKADYLKKCIEAILSKSTYENYEIIAINNNSESEKSYVAMEELRQMDGHIRFYDYKKPFNYPKINNYGVSQAYGEHVVLMNNDVEVISTGWIEALLEHSQREEIGAVGAKLYYPNDTIQHAGIIVGITGFAGHSHKHFVRDHDGYYCRLKCVQNISAVTGALMMVKKTIYQDAGGLDEINFSVSLNDVDFCLRLRKKGYLNIFTPYCEAYHHESASRGYEDTPEKIERFKGEIKRFQKRWHDILTSGDPYYNPNLTLDYENFTYRH